MSINNIPNIDQVISEYKNLESKLKLNFPSEFDMAKVLADNVIEPSETSIDKVWRSIWEKPLYANTKVEHGNKWIKKLETHMTDSLNTWGYEEELLIRKIGKTGKNIDFQIIGKLSSKIKDLNIAYKRLYTIHCAVISLREMMNNNPYPLAFLMDEPLSNLDASLRVHMRAELSELHRELKATFIYVTHDQAEALTMSDRIAVMMDGDLLQLGPPDEVYENPNDIRVAEFIGSPKMNILPATCDDKGVITCLGQKIKVALKNNKNQPVSIGIRPEHLILQPQSKASFKGELTYKENLGSDVFLHLDIGLTDQKVVIRTEPQESNSSKIGETISFSASHNKYLVFDENGKRIDVKEEGKV